jgi:Na+-translocating ferredoxin:NAD+ oxidoreductase subunit B
MNAPDATLLADRLDAALPQTQCRRCGHAGCRPYADAIAAGDPINRCPPGGDTLIAALATITGRAPVPLDESRGRHGPLVVARIDEARCIGCTLCLQACPVDAIAGAAKRMHTVLPALCTGCELCIPPCPVDCIDMLPAGRAWSAADAGTARRRYLARGRREAPADANSDAPSPRRAPPVDPVAHDADRAYRQQAVAAALARARARRAPTPCDGSAP